MMIKRKKQTTKLLIPNSSKYVAIAVPKATETRWQCTDKIRIRKVQKYCQFYITLLYLPQLIKCWHYTTMHNFASVNVIRCMRSWECICTSSVFACLGWMPTLQHITYVHNAISHTYLSLALLWTFLYGQSTWSSLLKTQRGIPRWAEEKLENKGENNTFLWSL